MYGCSRGAFVRRLKGGRIIMLLDNDATVGSIVKAPSGVLVAPAFIESFWRTTARPWATCQIEREPSCANTADVPGRGG